MKPKSAKAERKKLPKPKLAWIVENGHVATLAPEKFGYTGETIKCVLTPFPTLKSAKARLKIEQMTEEELVEGMAEEMHTDWRAAHGVPGCERWETIFENEKEPYRRSARSILSFLGRSGT